MHIAQMFFGVYLLLAFVGVGRFSLDYLILHQKPLQDNPFKWSLIALPVSLLLLSIGLYRELTISIVPEAETMEISSFNVPGSFNNWVPAANEMQQIDEDTYVLDVEFAASSVIEFKFTPNKS